MSLRVLAATVAGAIVLFMLGYAIWGVLFTELLNEGVTHHPGLEKETPNLLALFSSNLALAFLLTVIFEFWSRSRTFLAGLRDGAIIGFLICLAKDLSFLGYMNLFERPTPIVLDLLAETLRVSLAGGVIGAVLGWMAERAGSGQLQRS